MLEYSSKIEGTAQRKQHNTAQPSTAASSVLRTVLFRGMITKSQPSTAYCNVALGYTTALQAAQHMYTTKVSMAHYCMQHNTASTCPTQLTTAPQAGLFNHNTASVCLSVQVRIDAAALLHDIVEGWFPLRNIKGKTMRGGGEIKLQVRLIGIPDNPVYARGINAQDPNSAAVEDAFFPERGGNQVIMYQVQGPFQQLHLNRVT